MKKEKIEIELNQSHFEAILRGTHLVFDLEQNDPLVEIKVSKDFDRIKAMQSVLYHLVSMPKE